MIPSQRKKKQKLSLLASQSKKARKNNKNSDHVSKKLTALDTSVDIPAFSFSKNRSYHMSMSTKKHTCDENAETKKMSKTSENCLNENISAENTIKNPRK